MKTKRLLLLLCIIVAIVGYSLFNTLFKDSQISEKNAHNPEIPKKSVCSIIKAFYNTSGSSFLINSINQKNEKELNEDEYNSIVEEDGQFLVSECAGKYPCQRFDIAIKDNTENKNSIDLTWKGRSNCPVELYVWSYISNQWEKSNCDINRDMGEIEVKTSFDSSMLKDNTAHIMIKSIKRENMIQSKIPLNNEYDYTIAWITDTQYYSASYPEVFNKITEYIASNKQEQRIAYAVHTGDIVDNSKEGYQWKNADKSMKILEEANIPYGVLPGNHDVDFDKCDYNNYWKYFGENRFKDKSYFGESMDNNKNHYDLISVGDEDFIFLYFGWKVNDESIEWANQVLKKYSNRRAVIGAHSYIANHGTYYDGGQKIMDRVVKPNENVFMVLCGHFFGTSTYKRKIGNRMVHELFFNTQSAPDGGMGYFRLFHFDTLNDAIYVNTYSPYLNDYNYYDDSKDQFVIPLNSGGNNRIKTDLIEIR